MHVRVLCITSITVPSAILDLRQNTDTDHLLERWLERQ